MGKTSDGIKAGTLSGFVYGIISAIFTSVSLILFKTQVISALTEFMSNRPIYASHGITAQGLYNIERISGPVVGIILGVIIGLIIGIIYAHYKDRLPGSGSVLSGIILGLVFWIILGVLLGLSYLREYGTSFYELYVLGSLVAALSYGYVLAISYKRFEKSNVTITEPSYPKSD